MSRSIITLTWILRIGLAGLFLYSSYLKFSDDGQYIDEFRKVGFGDWLRHATGFMEVTGSIAIMVPFTALWGSAVLGLVVFGALCAQLLVLQVGWIHCIFIASLLLLHGYLDHRIRNGSAAKALHVLKDWHILNCAKRANSRTRG